MSAHEIVGRQMARGDTFVEFTDAARECPQRQPRRGVHDRDQHAVIGDRTNETEVDRAMNDEVLTGEGRVEEFEFRQSARTAARLTNISSVIVTPSRVERRVPRPVSRKRGPSASIATKPCGVT